MIMYKLTHTVLCLKMHVRGFRERGTEGENCSVFVGFLPLSLQLPSVEELCASNSGQEVAPITQIFLNPTEQLVLKYY